MNKQLSAALAALTLTMGAAGAAQALDPHWIVCTQGRPDQAVTECSLLIIWGGTPEKLTIVYNARGVAHARRGEADLAIQDFDKSIARDPTHAPAFYNRGNAHKAKHDFDLAIQDYDAALALDPKFVFAYNDRGLAHDSKHEYDLAIQDFDKAIALDPKDAIAYYNRSFSHASKGEHDLADKDYEAAVGLEPKLAKYGRPPR